MGNVIIIGNKGGEVIYYIPISYKINSGIIIPLFMEFTTTIFFK